MIQVSNISKKFNTVNALNDVSFQVNKGELFGMIGPDGAGKTTLFRILTTLLLPSQGSAEVAGFDVVKDMKSIRKIVGYMPGKFSLYQDLTITENLEFFATIFNTTVAENLEIIQEIYTQLEPFKNRRAGKLSGGMKQKLALCCALVHKPEVLFLDEPTTGVDAVSRKEFWQMLKRLQARGITILVSTPYMDEASLCDRIALIDRGKIMNIDTVEETEKLYRGMLYQVSSDQYYQCLQDLRAYENAEKVLPFGEYIHMTTHATLDLLELEKYLSLKGHTNVRLKQTQANVEDVFLQLLDEHD
jgi:ABC-type multidrug transport system ATPase subunit